MVVFAISAVALPLLLERDVGVLRAIVTSVAAVMKNWRVLIGWGALIVVFTAAGLVTFYLGLAVTLPLIGHATWHAYRDLVGRNRTDHSRVDEHRRYAHGEPGKWIVGGLVSPLGVFGLFLAANAEGHAASMSLASRLAAFAIIYVFAADEAELRPQARARSARRRIELKTA